jgi:hypothetical protein
MRTIWDYIIMLIGTLGSLASIIALCTFFSQLSTEGWIAVLFLGILCVFFVAYNFWLLTRYRKKTKYAEAYGAINIGFSHLHRLRRIENLTIPLILPELEKLCDEVSNAFNKIYDSNVGVCIKFIVNDNGRPRCETLVRDSNSNARSRKSGSQDTTKHWIDANSDFEFIYNNFNDENVETSYYLEQHLPNCHDYKNTRIKTGWKPPKIFLFPEKFARKWNWPLPYKSTLIVPIVPLIANDQSQETIRGFLCVDSPNEGVFNKYYDVDIMKGIADGIYNQIDLIHQLTIKESHG